jgi:hypothetical protein
MVQKLIPIKWKRPYEPATLNRLQIFSVFSEIGFIKINVLPYDFLYSPIPKFMLWAAKNLSLIVENMPFVRNFAGAIFVWARTPALEDEPPPAVDLCDHPMLYNNVSFIIPCHNEEMNVRPLVNNLRNFYDKYICEIIIVDDNSKDKTAEVTQSIAQEDPRVRLVKRVPPNGVGLALKEGLKAAKGEYLFTMDCDFQHIIPEMRDLFDALAEGADVALGSRFSRDSVLVNYPFTKILVNRAFHILANLLFQRHFRDVSNNLKLFRRQVTEKINIESKDFAVNFELGIKPFLMGYKVKEVPISWLNRELNMGLSTFKICKTGPNYLKVLLKIKREGIRQQ